MFSWQYSLDFDLVRKCDMLESVIFGSRHDYVTSVRLHDVMCCLMLLISYFSGLTSVQPLRISLHICTPSYLLLGSVAPSPPLHFSTVGTQGNAPLIMGTCPPNSSRHLTSKQTFVGCRVIGAPASRCKLDTSPVGTNIASPGGLWNVAVLTTTEVRHSLTRFLSQQAAAVGRPRVHLIYWRSKNVRKLVRLDLQKPTIENIWEWKCHSNTKSLGERNNTEYCVWHQLKAAWPLIEQIWH